MTEPEATQQKPADIEEQPSRQLFVRTINTHCAWLKQNHRNQESIHSTRGTETSSSLRIKSLDNRLLFTLFGRIKSFLWIPDLTNAQ